MKSINEKIVMDFFLRELAQDKVKFLVNYPEKKEKIKETILKLENSEDLHEKILVAKELWKQLFESAMGFIDKDRRGYDELFAYFDEFVNFEELIFASDSFYRDHTLHSLWVYFLGEYLFRSPEFQPMWQNFNQPVRILAKAKKILERIDYPEIFGPQLKTIDAIIPLVELEDSMRCVIALAHDLGYPLKKIAKINKAIRKILPYFAVFDIQEFKFKFDATQQFYINKFLELLGYGIFINPAEYNPSFEDGQLIEPILKKLNDLLMTSLSLEKIPEQEIQGIREELKALTPKQIHLLSHAFRLQGKFEIQTPQMLRFADDFEKFKHGILSSFLLLKLLNAFSKIDIHYSSLEKLPIENMNLPSVFAKLEIIEAIADHTSSYRISNFDNFSSLLILIDEIEEFSRISRANQFRQFINEFCKTEIAFEDNTLLIKFIFDNPNIPNLDPERAFKDKVLRFLRLFNVEKFDGASIRFTIESRLPSKQAVYDLTIAKNKFEVEINGVKQDIRAYLKTYETF
ncbi:MAG: hypothetical protein ACTSYD_11105 [Candidatus Heimdallarchaeaceae archaeon]